MNGIDKVRKKLNSLKFEVEIWDSFPLVERGGEVKEVELLIPVGGA
jgi:hypothetical protein